MNSKKSGDDDNASFEVSGSLLEDRNPGLDDREEKREDAAEGHHDRFPRRHQKDIPKGSLAERIRKAKKGG